MYFSACSLDDDTHTKHYTELFQGGSGWFARLVASAFVTACENPFVFV